MSYWNADSDLDWSEPNMPDDRLVSQCDCCGEYKPDCEDRTWRGMDVHACPKCRGAEAGRSRLIAWRLGIPSGARPMSLRRSQTDGASAQLLGRLPHPRPKVHRVISRRG